MEPTSSTNINVPPDRDRENPLIVEAASTNMTATAVSLPPVNNQLVLYAPQSSFSSISSVISGGSVPSNAASSVSAPIEKLSRPMAFDKMEALVKEMQDPESGVPVRSQKIFLTSIPSAFMGYDLIEWLMERLNVEESEALNMANQLCQHGYFFPVSDSKTLVVKDDSSLYRFQSPYYWPWRQQKAPDQIEYAIYLAKRSLRNKQRHALEDYETEALASLHKNLKGKWDFIMMQAEEQIKLAKDRKKGDKIVSDSQERAYWRVHRPPPGQFTPLEPCPVPSRDRQGKPRKRTEEDWKREVKITRSSIGRNRMKMSAACESLVSYFETFCEYDPLMQPALPSNPWVSEDTTFWQLNSPMVEVPTEKRVKRWSISIEELVKDPTGLQEFTAYLRKEYSHENIRFWSAVNDLRRSAHSQIARKAREIYSEFLEPGAPCEINIDGKTMEKVQQGLKAPSRFTFDVAAEHVYTLLLKKDCYPRFIRSEHYKNLLANAIQPSQKKRFFGFGGPAKKKPSTTTAPSAQGLLTQMPGPSNNSSLTRRRGSDRSLSGSAHELAVCGIQKDPNKVPHSHSQSNLSEIPYREPTKQLETTFETTTTTTCNVCPWDTIEIESEPSPQPTSLPPASPSATKPKLTVDLPFNPSSSSPSDIINTDVSERMKRSCGLRQNTLDCDFLSAKRLAPVVNEHRRASMTMAPRISDLQFNVTPPPNITTTDDDVYSTSELSLVINKADSIETKEDTRESLESLQQQQQQPMLTTTIELPCDDCEQQQYEVKDVVIEEASKVPIGVRKASMNIQKSQEQEELLQPPSSSSSISSLPASISTQTLPIDNFSGAISTINQSIDTGDVEVTQIEIQHKQQCGDDRKSLHEPTECKKKAMKKTKSRSIEEKERKLACDVDSNKSVEIEVTGDNPSFDEQHRMTSSSSKHGSLTHQQSLASQDDDYEISMVSGLLPGCVAPAPTPAPSIAPLAEIEVDPTEDDTEAPSEQADSEPKPEFEKKKKRRDKKDREGQSSSQDAAAGSATDDEKAKRNAVCPWEDEEMTTTVETPFVKTYATLGYL
ncbi:hypothetical protein PVAND_014035 [Polypedilum vanderplanki]|uniref:Regulator of G-protein signaling 7 n=1 Tax=Polypedilum vanderplanki TaxID=319348 RepID=A0A9J6CSI3_POLVA|nr:hypothetical protein PVAND_014035 [Polypedilum vanderplanki]